MFEHDGKTFVEVLRVTQDNAVSLNSEFVGNFPDIYKNITGISSGKDLVVTQPLEDLESGLLTKIHVGRFLLTMDNSGTFMIDEEYVDAEQFCEFMGNKENWDDELC